MLPATCYLLPATTNKPNQPSNQLPRLRNFLLAERIMTAASCTPVSYPRLPPTHAHPMWQAWDMAAEMCLLQLPQLLADPSQEFQPSSFFAEQLTAFELWLSQGSRDKKPPEQLPIVLQVGPRPLCGW
jgi:regulator-associated protein of mTOR